MVTFRREIRLWHETGVTQRALMIRDDADTCWLACQMRHGRITDPGPVLLSNPRSSLFQRRIDVDLFTVACIVCTLWLSLLSRWPTRGMSFPERSIGSAA